MFRYKPSERQQQLKRHNIIIEKSKAILIKRLKGKPSNILIVRPIPDIILVDFDEKKVYAVECSETTQINQKISKY